MGYEFGRVDLRLFDVHLSLSPLVAPDSLKPSMAFLSSPDAYRKQFEQAPFLCGDFRVRPLRKKSRLYHHFWRYYAAAFGKLDPWNLLLPFVCEPTGDKLTVVSPAAGIRVFARPVTYLFPFGWSNTVEMSVQGKLSPAVIQQFIATIRKSRDAPFQLGGKQLSLSGVFGEYSNRLKKACFTAETTAADFRRLDRYIIVSISRYAGSLAPYRSWDETRASMPIADKTMFHSLLLGEDVPMARIAAADGAAAPADFLLTRYQESGFAISYFDRGTLLFLQEAAQAQKADVLRCFSSNILLCLMMMRNLLAFYVWPDTQAANPATLLGQTRELAKQQLLAIPSRYTNPLCKTWFQYYGPWKNLNAPDKPTSA